METKQTLEHAIIAYFDEKTNDFINRMIHEVAEATNNEFMIANHLSPHMTIGIMQSKNLNGEFEKLNGYLKELNHQKVDVKFDNIGIFMPPTLYLGPILDSNLIALNQAIERLIKRAGGQADQHYSFNTWQPHATIAMNLTDEELEKSLQIIDKFQVDFTGRIEKLALTLCCPMQELAVYDLK